MLEWYQLIVPIDCDREHLPFLYLLRDAVSYLYLYDPRPEPYRYRVIAWSQSNAGIYRRFAFDTGGVRLEYPPSFHEAIERRMNATGRSLADVVADLAEERWPETQRNIHEQMQARGPLRNEELAVPAREYDLLMAEAMRNGILDAVPRHPQALEEPSTRLLIRSPNGRQNDLCTSYATTERGVGRFVVLAWRTARFKDIG